MGRMRMTGERGEKFGAADLGSQQPSDPDGPILDRVSASSGSRANVAGGALLDPLLLIGIGYEKCGTSTLAITLGLDPQFSIHPKKEAYYFDERNEKPFQEYLSEFNRNQSSRFLVDITPTYIRSKKAIEIIKNVDSRKKIIICLRDPIRRSYSHYVHNIFRHHSHYDPALVRYAKTSLYEEVYDLSFEESLERERPLIGPAYLQQVAYALDAFGRSNTLVLVLETDFRVPRLFHMISDFIKTEIDIGKIIYDNEGGFLPNIVCPEVPLQISGPRSALTLSEQGVYIFLSRRHAIYYWENVPNDARSRILEASCRWTSYVPAAKVTELRRRYFEEDIEGLEQLLGRDLSEWRSHRPMQSNRWFGIAPLRQHKPGEHVALPLVAPTIL